MDFVDQKQLATTKVALIYGNNNNAYDSHIGNDSCQNAK